MSAASLPDHPVQAAGRRLPIPNRDGKGVSANYQLLAIILFVLALRLPFLHQAIQGDDIYYLYGAAHAQIDPLHPTHARYAFLGQIVDMRGHPHPPLDSWFLGGLLALFGTVSEPRFHAVYIVFSLIAAIAALSLARRFTTRPLTATLLFLVTPAFVINGNSLEADLPFLAFWLASIALFVRAVDRRSIPVLALSAVAMTLAALTAYQAIVLVPILLLYGYKWKPAWIAALTPPIVIAAFQLFEKLTSGALPAAVLTGYMQSYGLQAFTQKLKSAVALTGHLGWLVFPALTVAAFFRRQFWILAVMAAAAFYDTNPLFWCSIGAGILMLAACATQAREFAAQWVLIFFASALVIFFAGSARYLLPIALPIAILVTSRLTTRWLAAGICLGTALSLALAVVNYQHWDAYRQFARSLAPELQSKRVWVNGEWGLRYYLEREGALPLMENQAVHPGEMVVASSLAYPIQVTTGGSTLAPVSELDVRPTLPLRLVALNGKAGYSTTSWGLRPFDISLDAVDHLRASLVVEAKPTLTSLSMNAPEAPRQIVRGVFDLENNQWRWTGAKAVLMLKSPAAAEPVEVVLYIPPQASARRITVYADGVEVAQQTYPGPGAYTLTTPSVKPSGPTTLLAIEADKTFSVPPDHRELGVILSSAGFVDATRR